MKQATTTGTGKYEALLERCRSLAPVPTAVALPVRGVRAGRRRRGGAEEADRPDPRRAGRQDRRDGQGGGPRPRRPGNHRRARRHAAAEKAVALVREGRAEVLMKGSLHTDELLSAVVSREKGLRTGRRISHAFLMDVPTYHKVLIVTDAAINIAPTLEDKVDICQNAIDLAISLGVKTPKVAILAAVETVNSKMPATLDAAALCKMADRGQIKGGLLDGPLAFDNAISKDAAKTKGIDVGGRRRSGHPARAGPGSRQHPGQAAQLPGERGQRRAGAGGEGPHHPHQPGRQRAVADRQLRRRRSGGPRPAGQAVKEASWTPMPSS